MAPAPPLPVRPAQMNIQPVAMIPDHYAPPASAAAAAIPSPAKPSLPARPASVPPAMMTADTAALRARLIEFYQRYNPAKLQDPSFNPDETLAMYRGREGQLFSDLERKYNLPPGAAGGLAVPARAGVNAAPGRPASPSTMMSSGGVTRQMSTPMHMPAGAGGGIPGGPTPSFGGTPSPMGMDAGAGSKSYDSPEHKQVQIILDGLKCKRLSWANCCLPGRMD